MEEKQKRASAHLEKRQYEGHCNNQPGIAPDLAPVDGGVLCVR